MKTALNLGLLFLLGFAGAPAERVALEIQPTLVFALADANQIVTVNPDTGATMGFNVGATPHSVAILPGGTRAYVGSMGGMDLTAVEMQGDERVSIPVGGMTHHLAASPDGRWVYAALGGSGKVAIVDTTTDTLAATLLVGASPSYIVFSPDGGRAYVTSMKANVISVVDTAAQRIVKEIPVAAGPDHLAMTPDGSRLVVTNRGANQASVIDTATGEVVAVVAVGAGPHGVALAESGDGRMLAYVGNRSATSMTVFDIATGEVAATVELGLTPGHILASPGGKYLYIASRPDKSLLVFDLARGMIVRRTDVGGDIHQVAILGGPNLALEGGDTRLPMAMAGGQGGSGHGHEMGQ